MITQPNISQDELKKTIQDQYSLLIKNLTFIPKGEVSWGYIVEDADSVRYFFKIHKYKKLSSARFNLLDDLHKKTGIINIIYPLATKHNKLETEVLGYPSVLFNYIEGKTAHEIKPTDKQYERLGSLLAQLHQAVKTINYPVRENFDIPANDDFLKVIEHLKETPNNPNKHRKEAFDLLKPLQDRLLEELKNLRDLQLKARASDIEFVLCHGEPSPGNIMLDNHGEVYLIDWDEPIVAPKEKDLLFFKNTMDPVLKGYSKHSADTTINPDLQSFYSLLWNINEIADWGERILFSESSEDELKHSISQLKDFLDYSRLGKSI